MNFLGILLFTFGLKPLTIYKIKDMQQKDLKKNPPIRVSLMVVITKWDHLFITESRDGPSCLPGLRSIFSSK